MFTSIYLGALPSLPLLQLICARLILPFLPFRPLFRTFITLFFLSILCIESCFALSASILLDQPQHHPLDSIEYTDSSWIFSSIEIRYHTKTSKNSIRLLREGCISLSPLVNLHKTYPDSLTAQVEFLPIFLSV
ncbi:hypothetical protein BY458DRAFT_489293 [Sporodiniella umbellata]|nr:hypothetical protein BY458DRAFT_489293 [Sporodiniella umbellata]